MLGENCWTSTDYRNYYDSWTTPTDCGNHDSNGKLPDDYYVEEHENQKNREMLNRVHILNTQKKTTQNFVFLIDNKQLYKKTMNFKMMRR